MFIKEEYPYFNKELRNKMIKKTLSKIILAGVAALTPLTLESCVTPNKAGNLQFERHGYIDKACIYIKEKASSRPTVSRFSDSTDPKAVKVCRWEADQLRDWYSMSYPYESEIEKRLYAIDEKILRKPENSTGYDGTLIMIDSIEEKMGFRSSCIIWFRLSEEYIDTRNEEIERKWEKVKEEICNEKIANAHELRILLEEEMNEVKQEYNEDRLKGIYQKLSKDNPVKTHRSK